MASFKALQVVAVYLCYVVADVFELLLYYIYTSANEYKLRLFATERAML